jgi:hypothetical protein
MFYKDVIEDVVTVFASILHGRMRNASVVSTARAGIGRRKRLKKRGPWTEGKRLMLR